MLLQEPNIPNSNYWSQVMVALLKTFLLENIWSEDGSQRRNVPALRLKWCHAGQEAAQETQQSVVELGKLLQDVLQVPAQLVLTAVIFVQEQKTQDGWQFCCTDHSCLVYFYWNDTSREIITFNLLKPSRLKDVRLEKMTKSKGKMFLS